MEENGSSLNDNEGAYDKERINKYMGNNSIRENALHMNDMIDSLESKIANIIGLLELVGIGAENIGSSKDAYELSGINVLKDYLSLINKTDIPKMRDMLKHLIDTE